MRNHVIGNHVRWGIAILSIFHANLAREWAMITKMIKKVYVCYIHIIQFWLDWRELSKNAFYKIKITLNSLQIWKIFNIWPHQLCKNLLEFLFGWLNTLQKKEVWDQLFCPAKRFKICHIYRKRKPLYRETLISATSISVNLAIVRLCNRAQNPWLVRFLLYVP